MVILNNPNRVIKNNVSFYEGIFVKENHTFYISCYAENAEKAIHYFNIIAKRDKITFVKIR